MECKRENTRINLIENREQKQKNATQYYKFAVGELLTISYASHECICGYSGFSMKSNGQCKWPLHMLAKRAKCVNVQLFRIVNKMKQKL